MGVKAKPSVSAKPSGQMPTAYIRSTDGAEMVEIAPHQYVNRAVLKKMKVP
jgi:hypothetical protein